MAACIRIATFACLLLAGTALAQAGKVYQWKDASGVTHYSDEPPPKGRYASREVAGDASQAPPAAPASAAVPDATTPAPANKGEQVAMANCTIARGNLERLKAGGDVGLDADGDGKPDAPLDADAVARQTELAQANINRYCGSAATP